MAHSAGSSCAGWLFDRGAVDRYRLVEFAAVAAARGQRQQGEGAQVEKLGLMIGETLVGFAGAVDGAAERIVVAGIGAEAHQRLHFAEAQLADSVLRAGFVRHARGLGKVLGRLAEGERQLVGLAAASSDQRELRAGVGRFARPNSSRARASPAR